MEAPVAEPEWKRLQELVDLMIGKGIHLSAGQVAGAVLKLALQRSEKTDGATLCEELREQVEFQTP
jgi:hypothetical protein